MVAATNRNLRTEIAASSFREDLYYRLAVVRMLVPPLRERPDDIPLLIQHFMRQFRPDRPLTVSPKIWAACADTTGSATCASSATWSSGPARSRMATTWRSTKPSTSAQWGDGRPSGAINVDIPFKEAKAQIVESFEREYIRTVLKRHNGNLSAAARAAEVDRKHLRELLRKHGLRESAD